MLLTKELENIMKTAAKVEKNYCFPRIDKNKESYYLDYSDSIHRESVITEYSSELLPFKEDIMALWKNSDNNCFTKDIVSSVMQTKDDEESVLEAIQLFNYMM